MRMINGVRKRPLLQVSRIGACLLALTAWTMGRSCPAFAFEQMAKGETVTYDIRKLGISVGEASLVYNGMVETNAQETLSITVTAHGFKFFDEEQIYLDPKTFYPVMIKRDLDIFGKKEKIVEHYDSKAGRVRIVKTAGGKTDQEVIEGGGRFDNIYGFIYRQRLTGRFTKGEAYDLHLPTSDVQLQFVEKKKVKLDKRVYEAYYIASVPKKYRVWFEDSPRRVPVKIDGAIGWGNMSMVIKEPAE